MMIDNQLKQMAYNDITEDDVKNDLSYIKNNITLNNDDTFIEFLIRSRSIIEYNKHMNELVGGKYFRTSQYKSMYSMVSEVIHFKSTNLDISYIKYVEKIFKKLTTNKIRINTSYIDLTNLDFANLLSNKTSNLYVARLKINKYLLDVIKRNGLEEPRDFATTGQLYELCEKSLCNEEKEIIELYLPILNLYSHSNDKFGLRRIDCSDLYVRNILEFANNII